MEDVTLSAKFCLRVYSERQRIIYHYIAELVARAVGDLTYTSTNLARTKYAVQHGMLQQQRKGSFLLLGTAASAPFSVSRSRRLIPFIAQQSSGVKKGGTVVVRCAAAFRAQHYTVLNVKFHPCEIRLYVARASNVCRSTWGVAAEEEAQPPPATQRQLREFLSVCFQKMRHLCRATSLGNEKRFPWRLWGIRN